MTPVKPLAEAMAELVALEKEATPGPWCDEAVRALLRYGQKHEGLWDEPCGHPDSDAHTLPASMSALFIVAARNLAPRMASALGEAAGLIASQLEYEDGTDPPPHEADCGCIACGMREWRKRHGFEKYNGRCGICRQPITNNGVTCSRGCPGDDGRGPNAHAPSTRQHSGGEYPERDLLERAAKAVDVEDPFGGAPPSPACLRHCDVKGRLRDTIEAAYPCQCEPLNPEAP